MSEKSYNELLHLLGPQLSVYVKQSMRSTSGNTSKTPEMTVGAGLQYLGGEFFKTIVWHYGIWKKSCEQMVNRFLMAVNNNRDFDICVPRTKDEFKEVAAGWSALSGAFGIFDRFVGALD